MADEREKSDEILEEDRINQLPDPLICHILGYLSIKDVVRTSVLSTRWRGLWLWVPRLELRSGAFPNFNVFVCFGDKFFDSERVSCIHNLELTINHHKDTSFITSWIDAAVKRKVQHLCVSLFSSSSSSPFEMPVSLFVCDTLVSLELAFVTLNDTEFVSFPRLKTMHLSCVWLCKDVAFERFVSCCPVLEDLQITGCADVPRPLRLYSRSLKRLFIGSCSYTQVDSVPRVFIDAPLLCYFKICDQETKSIVVNNLEYNGKLEVNVTFGLEDVHEASVPLERRSLICSFLSGILKVVDLTAYARTLQVIYNYSKSEPLPQFGHMSRLCVSSFEHYLKGLVTFLESCPNLKSLNLESPYYCYVKKMNHVNIISSVPKCLQSSLEFLELKFPVSGDVSEMKLLRYFLENSAVLKRLTLHLDSNSAEDEILKKLLEIPRASTKCDFVIVKKSRGKHM